MTNSISKSEGNSRVPVRELSKARKEHAFVGISRSIDGADYLEGFIVGQTRDWILLAKATGSLTTDGWVALRTMDLEHVDIEPAEDAPEARVLRARQLWPPSAPVGLDLSSLPSILRWAIAGEQLVTIYKEQTRLRVCWVISVQGVEGDFVRVRELGVHGEWARRTRKIALSSVTRIEFGGMYESGLLLLAEFEHEDRDT